MNATSWDAGTQAADKDLPAFVGCSRLAEELASLPRLWFGFAEQLLVLEQDQSWRQTRLLSAQ